MLGCRICQNTRNNRNYAFRELMFGTKEAFMYFQCSSCGCLQIKDIPEGLSRHYPQNYYSFSPLMPEDGESTFKKYLRKKRDKYVIDGKGLLGRLVSVLKPVPGCLEYLKGCGADFNSKVLDVGCGNQELLSQLARCGFNNLTGIDLYTQSAIACVDSVRIIKGELRNIDGNYDVLLFNHSFEHMADPFGTFKDAARLLSSGGHILLRMPVVPSYAWEEYGACWVQLDAPRHIFLHSLQSIKILAEASGFSIKKIDFDSTEFQFIGSEQYRAGIPLRTEGSYLVNPEKSIFSKKDIAVFRKRALELNKQQKGDQVCVYLTKN